MPGTYVKFSTRNLKSETHTYWNISNYKEDKENSVRKLKVYSEKGFYPIPLWKN